MNETTGYGIPNSSQEDATCQGLLRVSRQQKVGGVHAVAALMIPIERDYHRI